MKNKSHISSPLKGKSVIAEKPERKELVFSFKDFDHTQGQTFSQWEKSALLNVMLEKLKEYSRKTVMEAQKASFTIYGSFPLNSRFRHPAHITNDAIWASMHIQGKECVAGHLVGNVFYVVFLDKDHLFWVSPKKHT
jgi:hypothetical protein